MLYAFFGKAGEDGQAGVLDQIYIRWIVTWSFAIAWQVFFMQETKIGMVLSSVVIALSACYMNAASVRARSSARSTWVQTVSVSLPSSIFAGWSVAATSVQLVVTAFAYGASHDALVKASFAVLAVVLLIAMLQIFAAKDVFYVIPVVWALMGVDSGATDDSIHTVAKAGAAAVALAGLVELCIQVIAHVRAKHARQNFVTADKSSEPLLTKP